MTLQNRVTPWGEIEAVAARGTMMGNRGGKFHRPDRTLGQRRWASHHWICCDIEYKGMQHEAMGKGYTSLFFLDEVTALAAGHRPCFFCRRQEARRFLGNRKVDEFDRQLHGERLVSLIPPRGSGEGGRRRRTGGVPPRGETPPVTLARATLPMLRMERDEVPDGAMVAIDGAAYAVKGQRLLRWSHQGYTAATPRNAALHALLLTPPSIAAILASGYQPRWHQSALSGDLT